MQSSSIVHGKDCDRGALVGAQEWQPVSARLLDSRLIFRTSGWHAVRLCAVSGPADRQLRAAASGSARAGEDRARTMGHASISTTLNIYTHVVDASHRAAIESLEQRLSPTVPKSQKADTPSESL